MSRSVTIPQIWPSSIAMTSPMFVSRMAPAASIAVAAAGSVIGLGLMISRTLCATLLSFRVGGTLGTYPVGPPRTRPVPIAPDSVGSPPMAGCLDNDKDAPRAHAPTPGECLVGRRAWWTSRFTQRSGVLSCALACAQSQGWGADAEVAPPPHPPGGRPRLTRLVLAEQPGRAITRVTRTWPRTGIAPGVRTADRYLDTQVDRLAP